MVILHTSLKCLCFFFNWANKTGTLSALNVINTAFRTDPNRSCSVTVHGERIVFCVTWVPCITPFVMKVRSTFLTHTCVHAITPYIKGFRRWCELLWWNRGKWVGICRCSRGERMSPRGVSKEISSRNHQFNGCMPKRTTGKVGEGSVHEVDFSSVGLQHPSAGFYWVSPLVVSLGSGITWHGCRIWDHCGSSGAFTAPETPICRTLVAEGNGSWNG